MASGARTVIIAAGCRTPIGSLNGALSSLPGHELGAIAIKEALSRAKINPDKACVCVDRDASNYADPLIQVCEVLIGQILTAGQGQGPARQAAMKAGIPKEVPATGVNMLCGSGTEMQINGTEWVLK